MKDRPVGPTQRDLLRIRAALRLLASHPVAVLGLSVAGLPVWECTDHGGVWEGAWRWCEN